MTEDLMPAGSDLQALLNQAASAGTPAPIDVQEILKILGAPPAAAGPSSASVATPPFVAPPRPAAPVLAAPVSAPPAHSGGIDWQALLQMVAPLVGGLATHGTAQTGFLSGFTQGQEMARQHKLEQQQRDQHTNQQAADFLMHIGEHAQGFDDPIALHDFLRTADEAGAKAGFTKPGDLANRFQVSPNKLAEKRLKELTDHLDALEKGGYNLDDLASGGGSITLKDRTVVPVRVALALTRNRPLDASGTPIAKPTKLGNTEEERFIAKWAKENRTTVDALTVDQEMQARAKFREAGRADKTVASGGVDAQYNDLVELWKLQHPGREVPADVRTKLRLEANKVNDKATGLSGPGANSALDPDGIEYAATEYRVTGKMPALGMGNGAARAAIINGAAKQAKDLGQSAAAAIQRQAAYKADGAALTKMRTMSSAAEAFETKALAQADIVDGLSLKVDRTQYPILNDGLLTAKARILGDANTQLLYNALTTFTTEYAKIMEGSTGSAAGSTEGARAAAARLISAGLNKGQLAQTLDLMRREMRLTIHGYDATIAHITERMGGPTAPAATGGAAPIQVGAFTVKVK